MSEKRTLPPQAADTDVGAEQDAAALKTAKTPETMASSATTADSGPETRKRERAAPKPLFPIVGVGASAGGLAALEKLFTHMPPNTGAAFVIVQHLDITHKSLLHELLRRYTPMPVAEVEDGMGAEPNHLYVSSPPTATWRSCMANCSLCNPSLPEGSDFPSITSSAPWPRTNGSRRSASCSRAPATMAPRV